MGNKKTTDSKIHRLTPFPSLSAATAGVAAGGLGAGALATIGAIAGAVSGFAAGFAGGLLNGGSMGDAFKAGLEGAVYGGVSGAVGMTSIRWGVFCATLAGGVTGSATSYAQGDSYQAGFISGFAGGLAGARFQGVGKIFAGALVGGCASVVGGGKFENGAVTGAFTALTYALMSDPQVRQKIWGDIKDFAKGTWEFTERYIFAGSEPSKYNPNPLNYQYGENGGYNRHNGLDVPQGRRSKHDLGNTGIGDRLDKGGLFGGFAGHDKRCAPDSIFSHGPLRTVSDAMLIVDAGLAIIPGPRMAPILPSLEAAAGMVIAAPVHGTHLDRIIP